jgi:hypothetical protein
VTIAAEGNAEAVQARADPWRAGLAAAGDQCHVRLCAFSGARALCRWSVDWSLLCWRYLLALVIIFAGIRFTRLRLGTALRQGA